MSLDAYKITLSDWEKGLKSEVAVQYASDKANRVVVRSRMIEEGLEKSKDVYGGLARPR